MKRRGDGDRRVVPRVAPHAGARIETGAAPIERRCLASPPTRGRGLKHGHADPRLHRADVAPHAGARIETR